MHASCVRSIIPNFLAGLVQKTSMTKVKLFSVTSVNFGFILNVTTLIILITDISTVFLSTQHSFSFNSLSSDKNSLACCTNTDSNIMQWKDLRNDHISSLLFKPSPNIELLVYQFNNAIPENSTLKIFLHEYIITLT